MELNILTKLNFEPERFVEMLLYMGKGMLIIFILIGVIVLFTSLTNKIFSKNRVVAAHNKKEKAK